MNVPSLEVFEVQMCFRQLDLVKDVLLYEEIGLGVL